MDLYFLYFVLFSFILIALILFMIFFTDELKEVKGRFRWNQYIIYLLGCLFILVSISFSYFISLYGSFWFAVSVFIALNGVAVFFLYRASTMVREQE